MFDLGLFSKACVPTRATRRAPSSWELPAIPLSSKGGGARWSLSRAFFSLNHTPSEPPRVPGPRAASLERLVSAVSVLSAGLCHQSRNGAWAQGRHISSAPNTQSPPAYLSAVIGQLYAPH